MAQGKRKTKHRGNAAGMIETRGRTGRAPRADEKASDARGGAGKQPRPNRHDKPPTWRNAAMRGGIATAALVLISLIFIKNPSSLIALAPLVFIVYTAIGYVTDSQMHKRRMRQKAAGTLKASSR